MKQGNWIAGLAIGAAALACGPVSAQTLREKCEALASAAAAPDISQATFVAAGSLTARAPAMVA